MTELEQRYISAKRRLFEKVYTSRLNSEQARAVFTVNGPVLVLAGAGSGKTTVLVNRIAFIIKYGNAYNSDQIRGELSEGSVLALENAVEMEVSDLEYVLPEFITEPCPPWQLLAITFTNKAAREIKERLATTFDDPTVTEAIWAGTFHSICLRILRKYGERLGYRSGFSIYDTDDKKRMISVCMKELGIDEKSLSPKNVANLISRAKDRLEGPDSVEITGDPRGRDVARIYTLYDKKMMEYNALDFDDIIMRTVELLRTDEEVRSYYQRKFRHVLVDEYQDTNFAQFELTRLLSDGYRNIMVVGDDDQSIYRFRGATVENILNFDKTYPDATVIKLEENYRSTETILEAANAIIRNNDDRHDKHLWSRKGKGSPIVIREAFDQNAEGRYIIQKIMNGVREEGRKYSDYAVLYRVNEMARSLETSFTKCGMPYKILGSMRFYDRKEIKDIIAYLAVLSYEGDTLHLKRIINEPKRKIGDATVAAVEELASIRGVCAYEIMRHADGYDVLSKSAEKLTSFVRMMEKIKEENKLPSALIDAVFNETGYRAMLEAEGFEGEGRIASINEFKSAADEYEKRCASTETEPTLQGFLEEVALVSDVDKYDEDADAVVLMTIHSAKGLEFPIVFLAGMEDGIFPGLQNLGEPKEMSEERRLMYVAVTRAKEKLFITHAKSRTMYGRTGSNPLSVFVREELPRSLTVTDVPPPPPGRSTSWGGTDRRAGSYSQTRQSQRRSTYSELNRTPDIFAKKSTPSDYGLEKIPVGARVEHAMFGTGKILSCRDMGADILYEVAFDSGVTKKLMATFAKLKKL